MKNINPSSSGAVSALSKRTARLPVGIGYVLIAIVGATCLLVSAYYLWRLALLTGMPTWLSWSLPVALDVAAAGAAFYWVTGRKAARKWGRGIALTALAGTLAGNALSHLITFGLMSVSPLLVIVLGAVYPLRRGEWCTWCLCSEPSSLCAPPLRLGVSRVARRPRL